jgi:hypothetical protein
MKQDINHPERSHSCHCRCCAQPSHLSPPLVDVTRRQFLYSVGALTTGSLAVSCFPQRLFAQEGEPKRRPISNRALRVQPVLTYSVPKRREATSWRDWGGIQTEQDAAAEIQRITTHGVGIENDHFRQSAQVGNQAAG